jgi:hypothetical protein
MYREFCGNGLMKADKNDSQYEQNIISTAKAPLRGCSESKIAIMIIKFKTDSPLHLPKGLPRFNLPLTFWPESKLGNLFR